MNPAYISALKSCLSLKESAGIIGGKPNHAYYFMGFVGKTQLQFMVFRICIWFRLMGLVDIFFLLPENQLLYLDPHKTQPAVHMNFTNQMEIKDIVDATLNIVDDTYHCNAVHKMDFSLIDPSIALGW